MNTWEIVRLMSEEVKRTFKAVTDGPEDAIKFGDKTQEKKPTFNCNTHHRTQGWRTRSGSGNDSHALTDSVIVDIRLRDTDDWFSYSANYAQNHAVELKLSHDGDTVYTWRMSGIQDAATDDWTSSVPYLITKPGEWTLYTKSVAHHSCGVIGGGWKKVGSFTAKEAHSDCYTQHRAYGDDMGVCGECLDGYTEDSNGACVADTPDNGGSGTDNGGGSGNGDEDGPNMPLIIGGALGLILVIKLIKR